MQPRHVYLLMGLVFAGCGGPTRLELRGAGIAPAARSMPGFRGATASQALTEQVCPGLPARLAVVIPPGSGATLNGPYPESFADVQGTLYFATNLSDGSAALWRSNGTQAGTTRVKSFPAAPVGIPALRNLMPVGPRVFFQLDEPATGGELWVSDGTEAGTHRVEDLTPGPEGTHLNFVAAQNGKLTFMRQWSPTPGAPELELWHTDGTPEGTLRFARFGPESALGNMSLRVGPYQLFFLSSAAQGTALWRTDGTAAGTSLVKKVDAQPVPIVGTGQAGDVGLFLFADGANTEVWRTDGTTAGTRRVDAFSKGVTLLGTLKGNAYLASIDASSMRMRIQRLSLSGGGKGSVATLPNPHAGEEAAYPYLQQYTVSGGRLFFSVAIASPGPAPRAATLWTSDGTTAGTQPLSEALSLSDEYASPLFPVGQGAALFAATAPGEGLEPWFTHGTVASTLPLADIATRGKSSLPEGFTRVGDRIYFRAIDDTGSFQVWFIPLRDCDDT
ncbi:hypothetical protein LXT21_40290 [Myxococcus sp. K38C18041901]|uniref:hypothetical protein n=1 Tax=Myxococcus guangdongensis TaxID=2906760 RepID=UPI0020A76D39|nr:hypothetical protein [Myxococcus guangdongensis]MCP3065033.1 hypothetical protein [Myxococcus guangdongensis]